MQCDEVAREREALEWDLRLLWEHDDDFYDPLLCEIAAARNAMLKAEARMRLLIAYGREFTRPRAYRLEDLARPPGMCISGARTAYDDKRGRRGGTAEWSQARAPTCPKPRHQATNMAADATGEEKGSSARRRRRQNPAQRTRLGAGQ